MKGRTRIGIITVAFVLLALALLIAATVRVYDQGSQQMQTIGQLALARLQAILLGDKMAQVAATPFVDYTSADPHISFSYPSFLLPGQTSTGAREGYEQLTRISLASTTPFFGLNLVVAGDSDQTSQPGWYPPDQARLRAHMLLGMGALNFEKSTGNEAALRAAVDSATITEIAGYPASAYAVGLEDARVGKVYVRGATVIAPKYWARLVVFGLDDPAVSGGVTREFVDKVWSELAASLVLPE